MKPTPQPMMNSWRISPVFCTNMGWGCLHGKVHDESNESLYLRRMRKSSTGKGE
jgi:hypothetical protein